jgi:hypothetical protein
MHLSTVHLPQDRKYFDSGDYALSKAGVGPQNAVGTAIPNPEKYVASPFPRGSDLMSWVVAFHMPLRMFPPISCCPPLPPIQLPVQFAKVRLHRTRLCSPTIVRSPFIHRSQLLLPLLLLLHRSEHVWYSPLGI